MATYTNKLVRISLSGGLIGLVTTNPRRAIDNAIDKANHNGFHCHQIVPHSSVQASVARILRNTDFNFKTNEPILWTPPS